MNTEGMGMLLPPRTNVLGVGISVIAMTDAIVLSDRLIREGGKGYVCVTGVHGVIEAQSDVQFKRILNRSFLATPDGMPMVWIGRLRGYGTMGRVYGPEYMSELCRLSVERGYKHFLYGGNEGVALELAIVLSKQFPGIQIVGSYTPPFRSLNANEEAEVVALICEVKPDIMWIGLSTPKQERFMAEYLNRLDVKLMVGVGAAFDIHTGHLKDAPPQIKRLGLQWVHRLIQEPHRLWKRYLINNPKFVWNFCMQFVGFRKFNIES
jgi:N-acetylglucosaminyldiphosphoundecaprenol N-acetyl-beta-D-mannosaminyltransferase